MYILREKRQQIIDDLRLFWYQIKMEYQKNTNLLGTAPKEVPRFITKKWIEVHDQLGDSEDRYKPGKRIRFKTSMLRSDLCDFSDEYIVVKETITVTNPGNNAYDQKLAFKNNAPFVSCVSKINHTLIDNAEDLDVVMPMYNLLQYSKNFSKITGSFWNYYRDEPNSSANNNINYSIKDSKYFDYKTSITWKWESNKTEKEVEIVALLKHLSNFWRALDMPLINCGINLILTWSENCELTRKSTRDADPDADPALAAIDNPTNAIFKIKDTKLYVPVATLSTENDKSFLEQLRTGFRRTIKWNKYRSEMTNQIEMVRNNDYTTGNLLDCEYFSKHYRLIAINLSKQIELENSDLKQQFNFIGRLTRNERCFSMIQQCFSLLKSQKN